MVASILLLALGLAAALGALNAARPSQRWWTIMVSWSAAWVVLELSLHLIVFSALAAVVLIALGALGHTAGGIGLVLLVAADVAGVVWALTAQHSRSSLRDLLEDLDPEPDAPRFPRLQIVFPFLMLRARGVRHRRGVVYARDGRRPLKLDVYPAHGAGRRAAAGDRAGPRRGVGGRQP